MKSHSLILLSLLATGPLLAEHTDTAHKSLVNVNKDGVALEGYDPVAARTT